MEAFMYETQEYNVRKETCSYLQFKGKHFKRNEYKTSNFSRLPFKYTRKS